MRHVDWELIARHLRGDSTPAERQWLERISVGDPDVSDALAAMQDVARDGDNEVSPEQLLAHLKGITGAGTPTRRAPVRSAPRFAALEGRMVSLRVAAVGVLTLLGASALGWYALRARTPQTATTSVVTQSVISTAHGQRLTLRLSDGTLVTLAPGSTLRTPSTYGENERRVELIGEGVFTVVHDSARPFSVHTPKLVASDLGTRFLVRAYAEDESADVVVAEGTVAVQAKKDKATEGPLTDSVFVGRAERAHVQRNGAVRITRKVDLDEYFDWVDGTLVFRAAPLGQVVERLERWYAVEIRLDPPSLAERRLIASVEKDEPVTSILRAAAASLDLTLSRSGRVYTLSTNPALPPARGASSR
jgi:transmembrane sensor